MPQVLTTPVGSYDEALERLHETGPEFEGWLSNHGPMAVEALARLGAADAVPAWTDGYLHRLEDRPRPSDPIPLDGWRPALGDPRRLGDWLEFFERRLAEAPWDDALVTWWPRLLPGIAAGATHGVIRVGHAVQALRAAPTPVRRRELAHALGYWAARWQPVPGLRPTGRLAPAALVTRIPRVAHQEGGISHRLAQLDATQGWADHVTALAPPSGDDVPAALDALVDAVVLAYPRIAPGQPTMLVHAATAPNAVRRVLPSLPTALWADAHAAAWAASAAVLAAYLPQVPADLPAPGVHTADEAWDVAVRHGGEHVVKLADTALDVHARTQDPAALAAITTAVRLDA